MRILDGGQEVANLPVKPLTEEAPQYERPTRPPEWLPALQAFDPLSLPPPKDNGEALLHRLLRRCGQTGCVRA